MFTCIIWVLLIIETLIMGDSGKTCKMAHLQELYCRNIMVFKARLRNHADQRDTYTMEILELFKGTSSELSVQGHNYIDVKMKNYSGILTAKKFVIFGHAEYGIFVTDQCTGVCQWNELTTSQKDGLLVFYKTGCDCVPEIPEYNRYTPCIWFHGFMVPKKGNCVASGGKSFRRCQQILNRTLMNPA